MGREVIAKQLFLPAFAKDNRYFLFVSSNNIQDIAQNHKICDFLGNLDYPTNIRICYHAQVQKNRIEEDDNIEMDKALAILFNLSKQYQLPVSSNIGSWNNLPQISKVAPILLVDDYLAFQKNELVDLFLLKKPVVIDTHLFNPQEILKVLDLSEKNKSPISLLTHEIMQQESKLYENFFVFLKLQEINHKIIKASLELGIKGFFLTTETKSNDFKQLQKIITTVGEFSER